MKNNNDAALIKQLINNSWNEPAVTVNGAKAKIELIRRRINLITEQKIKVK